MNSRQYMILICISPLLVHLKHFITNYDITKSTIERIALSHLYALYVEEYRIRNDATKNTI